MKQGFASALGGAPQGNPQQAVQQLTQMLQLISGIHNEHTYQAVKSQFEQAGVKGLTKTYKKHEVENCKKILIKGINHLMGMTQQQQATQAPQQPAAPGGAAPMQSSAPAPQGG